MGGLWVQTSSYPRFHRQLQMELLMSRFHITKLKAKLWLVRSDHQINHYRDDGKSPNKSVSKKPEIHRSQSKGPSPPELAWKGNPSTLNHTAKWSEYRDVIKQFCTCFLVPAQVTLQNPTFLSCPTKLLVYFVNWMLSHSANKIFQTHFVEMVHRQFPAHVLDTS